MTRTPHITIIGTGMGGLCAAMQLLRNNIDNFILIEKEREFGGTWRDNIYPGCACDVPSHFYSFSFEGKPDWSRIYPPRDEIFDYMTGLAAKYGLYEKTQFNTEITEANYNEATQKWQLTTAGGETLETDIVITGLGQLNRPKTPKIKDQRKFNGITFHAAQWQYETDLTGKRIGVIGNGPSAAQFIPEVAKEAGHLTIFQRSPCHVVPRNDREYNRIEKFLFKYVPGLRKLYRGMIYWTLEKNFNIFNRGNKSNFWIKLFSMGGTLEEAIETHFDEQIEDKALRKILKPDYPIGCKRVVISDDYYPTLQRDNVSLVVDGIKQFTANGIKTINGDEHNLDVIIYGTGFESTDFLAPLYITGKQGKDLNTTWRQGAEAYLGITMPDFPNFFMLYGPNTNLGHNSILFMLECQVNYIIGAIKSLSTHHASSMSLKPEKMQEFGKHLKARLETSVWAADCQSWYKNEHGKITNNWPDFTYLYREATQQFDAAAYEIVPPPNQVKVTE